MVEIERQLEDLVINCGKLFHLFKRVNELILEEGTAMAMSEAYAEGLKMPSLNEKTGKVEYKEKADQFSKMCKKANHEYNEISAGIKAEIEDIKKTLPQKNQGKYFEIKIHLEALKKMLEKTEGAFTDYNIAPQIFNFSVKQSETLLQYAISIENKTVLYIR